MTSKEIPANLLTAYWKHKVENKKVEGVKVRVVNNGPDEIWKSAEDAKTKAKRRPDGTPEFQGHTGAIKEFMSGYGEGVFVVVLDKPTVNGEEVSRKDFGFELKSVTPLETPEDLPVEYIPGVYSRLGTASLIKHHALVEGMFKKHGQLLVCEPSDTFVMAGYTKCLIDGTDFTVGDFRYPKKAKTWDDALATANKRLSEPPALGQFVLFSTRIMEGLSQYKGSEYAVKELTDQVTRAKRDSQIYERREKIFKPMLADIRKLQASLKQHQGTGEDTVRGLSDYLHNAGDWAMELPKLRSQIAINEKKIEKLKSVKYEYDPDKEYKLFTQLIKSGILERCSIKDGLLEVVTAPLVFRPENSKAKYFMGRCFIRFHDKKCARPSDCRGAEIYPVSFKLSDWVHPHMNGEGYTIGKGRCRFGCLGSYEKELKILRANGRIAEALVMYIKYLTTDGGDKHVPAEALNMANPGTIKSIVLDDSYEVYLKSQEQKPDVEEPEEDEVEAAS